MYFLLVRICLCWAFPVSEISCRVAFCGWLLLLRIMFYGSSVPLPTFILFLIPWVDVSFPLTGADTYLMKWDRMRWNRMQHGCES